MTDRPIPFTAAMVAALLAGTKTQTRRLLRNPEYYGCPTGDCPHSYQSECNAAMAVLSAKEAGYAPGDRLYVREAYYQRGYWVPEVRARGSADKEKWGFVAEGNPTFDAPTEFRLARKRDEPWTVAWHKRLGRFMPRAYSRMTLVVTDVRVERLQDISEGAAIAEGTPCAVCGGRLDGRSEDDCCCFHRKATAADYCVLWDAINGPGAWDANPWIVAISFSIEHRNIDQ